MTKVLVRLEFTICAQHINHLNWLPPNLDEGSPK